MPVTRTRLVAFLGERERGAGGLLAEVAIAALTGAGMEQSILVRGSEGFGARHRRQDASLLSLSEDLPMVITAAGGAQETTEAAGRLRALSGDGLVLLEGGSEPRSTESCRVEVWLRRGRRIGRTPAHRVVIDAARACGAEAAVALLGVDGSSRGNRERAGFFSANAGVPLVVTALMPPGSVGSLSARLAGEVPGAAVDAIPASRLPDEGGLERLTVCGTDAVGVDGRPLHSALTRIVRREGGAGATTCTGIYGFSGDSEPRGDLLLQARRRVPVMTEVIDTPANCERWQAVARGLGDEGVRTLRTPARLVRA